MYAKWEHAFTFGCRHMCVLTCSLSGYPASRNTSCSSTTSWNPLKTLWYQMSLNKCASIYLIRSLLKDCEVSESVFKTPFRPVFVAIQTRGCRSMVFDRILPPLNELWESLIPPYKLMSLQTSFGETMTHSMLILWRLRRAHMLWNKSINQLDILKIDDGKNRRDRLCPARTHLPFWVLQGLSQRMLIGVDLGWMEDGKLKHYAGLDV